MRNRPLKRIVLFLILSLVPLFGYAAEAVLQSGDILHITMPGEEAFNKDFSIDISGKIILPEAGSTKLSGMKFEDAKEHIRTVLSKAFRDLSHLNIILRERRFIVKILGAVGKPGSVLLPENANIQMAIEFAGGLVKGADPGHMQLRRGDKVETFNYRTYLDTGDAASMPGLRSKDEIFIPTQTLQTSVQVMGGVRRPGRFSWRDDMTLLDLLADAGGPAVAADTANIKIVRKDKSKGSTIFDMEKFIQTGGDLSSIPEIGAGDTIIVPEGAGLAGMKSQWLSQQPKDTIYVFGQVRAPGRYKFNKTMGFLDILSAADGPTPDADTRNIRVIDRSKRRPNVAKVNLPLYFETGDNTLLPRVIPGDVIFVPSRSRGWLEHSPQSTVRLLGAANRPGRYQFTDRMTVLDLLAEAGGLSKDARISKLVVINFSSQHQQARRFDLKKFSRTGDPRLLPVLRSGDTVYVPSRLNSLWNRIFEKVRDVASMYFLVRIFDDNRT